MRDPERALELVAGAQAATMRTPDTLDRFAWFLLTCDDKSFRDPPQGRGTCRGGRQGSSGYAVCVVHLVLAQYRNGDWQAAEDAVQRSIKFAPTASRSRTTGCCWR